MRFLRKEATMSTIKFPRLIAAALLAGTAVLGGPSVAAPIAASGMRGAADGLGSIEQIQHVWQGRRYCWTELGWNGAGWYRCGFATRHGQGWGGPAGWHRWRVGARNDIRLRRGSGGAFQQTPAVPSVGTTSGSVRGGTTTDSLRGGSTSPTTGSGTGGSRAPSTSGSSPSGTSGGSSTSGGASGSSGGSSGGGSGGGS